MLTLQNVLTTAAAYYSWFGETDKLDDVREYASIWEDLLDAPLEDLQLSRVPEPDSDK